MDPGSKVGLINSERTLGKTGLKPPRIEST